MKSNTTLEKLTKIKLLDLVGWLWVIALPLWVVVGFYFNYPVTEQFSAQAADDWCVVPIESIGFHCFGDLRLPIILISSGDAWVNQWSIPQPYSAIGLWPFLPSIWLTNLGASSQLVLILTIIFFGACLLIPALISMRMSKTINKWAILLSLGIISTPSLIALDRGASVALSVPLLAWTVFSFYQGKRNQLLLAIILLALLRPQFLVLSILFLSSRDYKRLFLAPLIVATVTFASFWAWPGNPLSNLTNWVRNIVTYTGYGSLTSEWPNNYSAARAVWRIIQSIGLDEFNAAFSLEQHAREWINLPGLVLLAIVTFAIWSLRNKPDNQIVSVLLVLPLPMLVPGTSWGYYLTFVLVIGMIFIVGGSGRSLFAFKNNDIFTTSIRMLTILVLAITLVPIPAIPNSVKNLFVSPPIYSNGFFTPWIGASWLALVIFIAFKVIYVSYLKKKPAIID